MSHRSHSLDEKNDDALEAHFVGDHGTEAFVKTTSGDGNHDITVVCRGQTIELSEDEALDLRNQINRGRLFAKHQGALKFQRNEREAKIKADEEARKEAQEAKERAERERAAERARLKAEAAAKEAEEAEAAARAAEEPPVAPETPSAPPPAPPLSEPPSSGNELP